MNKVWIGLAILAISSGCAKSSSGLLDEIISEQEAVMAKAEKAFKGCVAPLEVSRYKDNFWGTLQVFQFCQRAAFTRGADSIKRGDRNDRTFLRSCLLSYIDFVGVPSSKEQKSEAVAFCDSALVKQKAQEDGK